jgi:hypothetical protein
LKRIVASAASLACVALAMPCSADTPAQLARLFRQKADIVASGPDATWADLELPAEILRACRPDLADVRVLDAVQAEVPFAIETQGTEEGVAPERQVYPAKITGVDRHAAGPLAPGGGKAASGGSGAKVAVRETYQVVVRPPPSRDGTWALTVQSTRSDYARKVRVVATDAGQGRLLATRADVFRLAQNGAEVDRVALSAPPGAHLEITLEGDDVGFLEPTFALERSPPPDATMALRVPLETLLVVPQAGHTEITVVRPPGILPTALDVLATTDLYDRRVTVIDNGGPADGVTLGTAMLCHGQCAGSGPTSRIALAPARGDRLRLIVEDGDSPPLAQPVIDAIIPRPVLRIPFSALRGGTATLLFGSNRVRAPRYDLAHLATLSDDGSRDVRAARVEAVRANDGFDPSPALAWAMHPGGAIDASPYRFARSIALNPSADGLSRVVLEPGDTAAARADLGDVRVVGGTGAQWPYLLDSDWHGRWLGLTRAEPKPAAKGTRIELRLPSAPLPVDALGLDIGDAYFHRVFHVSGTGEDGREIRLKDGELVRDAGAAVRMVETSFEQVRVKDLFLDVEDGDDAPLDLHGIRAHVGQPVLFVAAPAGSYSLLLGDPEASAPSYDIQQARDVVLALSSTAATLGALGPNPSFRSLARLDTAKGLEDVALWCALGITTLALAVLTLRLARAPKQP